MLRCIFMLLYYKVLNISDMKQIKSKRKTVHRKKYKSVLQSQWLIAAGVLVAAVFLNSVSGGAVLTAAKALLGTAPAPTPSPAPAPSDIVPYGGYLKQSDYVNMASQDLVKKLNISSREVSVVSVTQKDWGDTSLGCPQRNSMYSQVITPGYIIVLQENGKSFTYNAGAGKVVSCK